jgi:hypothetical protein
MAHKMFKAVDERTGFRTTQVLAAPVLSAGNKLLGVVELLNRIDGRRFPTVVRNGLEASSARCLLPRSRSRRCRRRNRHPGRSDRSNEPGSNQMSFFAESSSFRYA